MYIQLVDANKAAIKHQKQVVSDLLIVASDLLFQMITALIVAVDFTSIIILLLNLINYNPPRKRYIDK